MPTAVSGNTSHVTGTYKGGSGTYKFLPMTSAGDAADRAGDERAAIGVSWARIESDGTSVFYCEPWYGDPASPPTAWDASPAPQNAGDISYAKLVPAGGYAEFGVKSDPEGRYSVYRGSGSTMITGMQVWCVTAGMIPIQGH